MLRVACIELPERDVSSGARAGLRQRRAPRAATENENALNAHLYAAVLSLRPRAAATSSSGQRAFGATSNLSVRPSASRSAPAQAIIAPLSVHNCSGGRTSAM